MQRLSPLMKGLVETRARADADHQNALQAASLRTEHLSRMVAEHKRLQGALQRSITYAYAQAKTALNAREACDQLIQKVDSTVTPALIEPINAWQGRYGQRGALGKAVQDIVEMAYPAEITTTDVAARIQQQFGLTFATPKERKTWVKTSIQGRLGYLLRLGIIERLHDPKINSGKAGRWRAIPAKLTNNDLVALATKAGIPLTYFTGELVVPEDSEEDDLPK